MSHNRSMCASQTGETIHIRKSPSTGLKLLGWVMPASSLNSQHATSRLLKIEGYESSLILYSAIVAVLASIWVQNGLHVRFFISHFFGISPLPLFVAPPCKVEDIPEIDAVVISVGTRQDLCPLTSNIFVDNHPISTIIMTSTSSFSNQGF
jgi:hypothetical protein